MMEMVIVLKMATAGMIDVRTPPQIKKPILIDYFDQYVIIQDTNCSKMYIVVMVF